MAIGFVIGIVFVSERSSFLAQQQQWCSRVVSEQQQQVVWLYKTSQQLMFCKLFDSTMEPVEESESEEDGLSALEFVST